MSAAPFAVILEQLANARRIIDDAEAGVRSIMAGAAGRGGLIVNPGAVLQHARPLSGASGGPLAGLKTNEAVVAVLRSAGGVVTVPEVVSRLRAGGFSLNSGNPSNAIRSVLHRLRSDGAVVRRGSGWELVDLAWTAGPKADGYHAYLRQRLMDGVTMEQAAEEYRQRTSESSEPPTPPAPMPRPARPRASASR